MNESSPNTPSTAPDFLTVEEAAQVLRLGRTAAYREVRRYEASKGAIGIPVERFGKQFRVPRYRIEEKLGGPITWPLESTVATAVAPPALKARTTRRRPQRGDEPPRLFSVYVAMPPQFNPTRIPGTSWIDECTGSAGSSR